MFILLDRDLRCCDSVPCVTEFDPPGLKTFSWRRTGLQQFRTLGNTTAGSGLDKQITKTTDQLKRSEWSRHVEIPQHRGSVREGGICQDGAVPSLTQDNETVELQEELSSLQRTTSSGGTFTHGIKQCYSFTNVHFCNIKKQLSPL